MLVAFSKRISSHGLINLWDRILQLQCSQKCKYPEDCEGCPVHGEAAFASDEGPETYYGDS